MDRDSWRGQVAGVPTTTQMAVAVQSTARMAGRPSRGLAALNSLADSDHAAVTAALPALFHLAEYRW